MARSRGSIFRCAAPTNKSWLLRYERDGVERWHGLGPADTFSLKEARLRARAARQLLKDGVDPIDAPRRSGRERVEGCQGHDLQGSAEAYISANETRLEERQACGAVDLDTLKTYVYPKIGDLSVADIDTGWC